MLSEDVNIIFLKYDNYINLYRNLFFPFENYYSNEYIDKKEELRLKFLQEDLHSLILSYWRYFKEQYSIENFILKRSYMFFNKSNNNLVYPLLSESNFKNEMDVLISKISTQKFMVHIMNLFKFNNINYLICYGVIKEHSKYVEKIIVIVNNDKRIYLNSSDLPKEVELLSTELDFFLSLQSIKIARFGKLFKVKELYNC